MARSPAQLCNRETGRICYYNSCLECDFLVFCLTSLCFCIFFLLFSLIHASFSCLCCFIRAAATYQLLFLFCRYVLRPFDLLVPFVVCLIPILVLVLPVFRFFSFLFDLSTCCVFSVSQSDHRICESLQDEESRRALGVLLMWLGRNYALMRRQHTPSHSIRHA